MEKEYKYLIEKLQSHVDYMRLAMEKNNPLLFFMHLNKWNKTVMLLLANDYGKDGNYTLDSEIMLYAAANKGGGVL